MTGRYRIVQQVGDATFIIGERDSEPAAILEAANRTIASDEEIEVFVDGPGGVVQIGQPRTFNGEWD